MRVLVPVGTRPEIIKLAPVVRALADHHDVRVVATGQHHDPAMAGSFFTDLGVEPAARWNLTGTPPERLGALVTKAVDEVATVGPDLVLVLGDTHTVPAFCLAARLNRTPVAHLEAGLRSFNQTSMEEVNRRIGAATASLHLAPTERAAGFLRREGVDEARIRVVGNPVTDALRASGVARVPVDAREGIVVTAHRATNVDDPGRLATIVDLIGVLHREYGPVLFPVHPRTADRLGATGLRGRLESAGVRLTDPLPYQAMLEAVASARVVVTDSGGLQEEAAWLGVPVVVLRTSTPRWEGVDDGTAVLCGLDPARAQQAVTGFLDPAEAHRVDATPCPYGDGHTAERVVALLAQPEVRDLLVIAEPGLDALGLDAVELTG